MLPTYSLESEDVYILDSEDENDNLPDPRLELIDRKFNLKMKEVFSQASSGQVAPHTVEGTLQQTTNDMLQYLAKSHPLTWVPHVKTPPEEDELPLWMTIWSLWLFPQGKGSYPSATMALTLDFILIFKIFFLISLINLINSGNTVKSYFC